jgi:hypothetical protein
MKKKCRVIIDTNLWISFLISKDFEFLDKFIIDRQISLIFCDELLTEFVDVIRRPRLKPYFSDHDIEMIIDFIFQYSDFFEISSVVDICRDKKDNFLLALSKDSMADYLLTGDKDLISLQEFGNTKIITLATFKDILL